MQRARRIVALLGVTGLLAAPAAAQMAPMAGLTLIDHRQQRVTAEILRGTPVLLHFVFAGCSTTCPVQVNDLVALRAGLPPEVRERVRFVSVSVDPVSDTPASLAAFARRMGADQPGWRFVTGSPEQIERFTARMQAFDRRIARPTPADHRTSLWLYDADGVLVQRYAGVPVDRPRLTEEIGRVVARSAPVRSAAAAPPTPAVRPTATRSTQNN